MVTSIGTLIYFISVRPFEEPLTHYFEIYNEFTVLIISVSLLCYIDNIEDDNARYNFGWVLTGLIMINIFANLLNIIATTSLKLVSYIKTKY